MKGSVEGWGRVKRQLPELSVNKTVHILTAALKREMLSAVVSLADARSLWCACIKPQEHFGWSRNAWLKWQPFCCLANSSLVISDASGIILNVAASVLD